MRPLHTIVVLAPFAVAAPQTLALPEMYLCSCQRTSTKEKYSAPLCNAFGGTAYNNECLVMAPYMSKDPGQGVYETANCVKQYGEGFEAFCTDIGVEPIILKKN